MRSIHAVTAGYGAKSIPDAVAGIGQKPSSLQAPLEDGQRFSADCLLGGDQFRTAPRRLAGHGPVTQRGQAVLDEVLFEEHPPHHLRLIPGIGRKINRALCQVEEYRVRLREHATILEFQYRHASRRAFDEE
jgi:hypothetical protein